MPPLPPYGGFDSQWDEDAALMAATLKTSRHVTTFWKDKYPNGRPLEGKSHPSVNNTYNNEENDEGCIVFIDDSNPADEEESTEDRFGPSHNQTGNNRPEEVPKQQERFEVSHSFSTYEHDLTGASAVESRSLFAQAWEHNGVLGGECAREEPEMRNDEDSAPDATPSKQEEDPAVTSQQINDRATKALRLLGRALYSDTAWEDRDGMAQAAFAEAREGRALLYRKKGVDDNDGNGHRQMDSQDEDDEDGVQVASDKGRLYVMAAAVSTERVMKREYRCRAQHCMYLILPLDAIMDANLSNEYVAGDNDDSRTLDWTGFDRLLHAKNQGSAAKEKEQSPERKALPTGFGSRSKQGTGNSAASDLEQQGTPTKQQETTCEQVSTSKGSSHNAAKANTSTTENPTRKLSKMGRVSWITRLARFTRKRKWWRRNKSTENKHVKERAIDIPSWDDSDVVDTDSTMATVAVWEPSPNTNSPTSKKDQTHTTNGLTAVTAEEVMTGTREVTTDAQPMSTSAQASHLVPHTDAPLQRRRDVVAETNKRIQMALLTETTETLTSYDLVKKFGEQPNEDNSVEPVDCFCMETAGLMDDMMGLNVDSEDDDEEEGDESKKASEASVTDARNCKRAPKTDPHFVFAPSGSPAFLTAKSWDTLIDTGAARPKDRRHLRNPDRPRLEELDNDIRDKALQDRSTCLPLGQPTGHVKDMARKGGDAVGPFDEHGEIIRTQDLVVRVDIVSKASQRKNYRRPITHHHLPQ